jgi:hypothetical protein
MAIKGRMPTMMTHKQTTATSMTTTPNTTTNANTNANAPVAAADDCDRDTAYITSTDLCALYITLEEARKERSATSSCASNGAIAWKTRRSARTSARALPRRRR